MFRRGMLAFLTGIAFGTFYLGAGPREHCSSTSRAGRRHNRECSATCVPRKATVRRRHLLLGSNKPRQRRPALTWCRRDTHSAEYGEQC